MNSMFRNATVFNQDLSNWDVSGVSDMTNIFTGTALNERNYSSILTGWSAQALQSSVTLDADTQYLSYAKTQRQSIITTYSWTINDGGQKNFYLDTNGITILCPDAAVGDSDDVNGVTYTKREGEWSETRSFTTGTSSSSTIVLEIPELISPIDDQQNVLRSPLFRWSHVPNSDSYHIQITTDFEFGSFDFETANLDTNAFTLSDSLDQNSVYYWRVKALGNQTYLDSDWSKTFTFTTAVSTTIRETEHPVEFSLRQNYPNPFNPVTKIQFSIPRATKVRVEVYTILGQTVAVLQNGLLASGVYTLDFDATNLSSGTYLYRIVTPEFSETKVMLLLK